MDLESSTNITSSEDETCRDELAKHKEIIAYLCRLCGKNGSSESQVYNKLHFKEEMHSIYGIVVENESQEVFPSFICKNDARILYRYRETKGVNSPCSPLLLQKELPVFKPHTENCTICLNVKIYENRSRGRPAKRKRSQNRNPTKYEYGETSVEDKEVGSSRDAKEQPSEPIDLEGNLTSSSLLNAMKSLLLEMDIKEKEHFFQTMLQILSPSEIEVLSFSLGKSISTSISDDAQSYSLLYKDAVLMASFKFQEWLKQRNKSLLYYILGIGNINPCFDLVESSKSKYFEKIYSLPVARALEQLYMIRCPGLISPISFLLNVCIYAYTGSKSAVDIIGNCNPSGHYKTVTGWLREQASEEPKIPEGNLMNIFDNEQVIGRKHAIKPNNKVNVSVITNKGIVLLKSGEMIQDRAELKPIHIHTFKDQEYFNSLSSEHQDKLKSAVNELLSESTDQKDRMERDHYEQLYFFVDEAIQVVSKEQRVKGNDITDSVDNKVSEELQDETMTKCAICGTLNRKRKLKCEGCSEREGLKRAKLMKKSDQATSSKPELTYIKLKFTQEDKTITVEEDNGAYSHVKSGHQGSHEVLLTDPVFCNPNSYETVARVLSKIGKDNGISKYSGTDRHWTFVCCDGLPFMICKKLMEEAVMCIVDDCNEKFMSKAKLLAHAKQAHPDKENCQYIYEFDWFYLRIGGGHYEMNLIKSFFELNWLPFLETLSEKMGFTTETAKQYAKSCKDLHKSWNLLLIFHVATLRELVLHYVRSCLKKDITPEAKDFFKFINESYQSPDKSNFKYMVDQVCRYSQGIINFRMAIRRNNADLSKSAKYMTKELFHGRKHPKYQAIEIFDRMQDILMPDDVKKLNDSYVSITTSKNHSTGEDFDFILEEKNRQLKSWIPKGVPTDLIWQTVCRNNHSLKKLKDNSSALFGLNIEWGKSRPLDIEEAVDSFRSILRKTDYLNMSCDHKSISGIALDEEMVNFIQNATLKRIHYIRSEIQGIDVATTPFLRHVLPLTPQERQNNQKIENMTLVQIRSEIQNLLEQIPKGLQYDYHQNMYYKEVKGKNKDCHVTFLQELRDALGNEDETKEVDDESKDICFHCLVWDAFGKFSVTRLHV